MGDVLRSQIQLGHGEATIDRRFAAEDEAFFGVMMPEEGRSRFTSSLGTDRSWFRAENVMPIEHYRRSTPTALVRRPTT
jgi:hypothetical protein